jgi:hypothetical protein
MYELKRDFNRDMQKAYMNTIGKRALASQRPEQRPGVPEQEQRAESEVYAINWSNDDDGNEVDTASVAAGGPAPEQEQQEQQWVVKQ